MMKKTALLFVVVALLSLSVSAEPTCQGSDDLAWLFEPGAAGTQSLEAAAPTALATKAICQASCPGGSSVSCSYTPPSTCSAVDSNCSLGVVGYVQCGGNSPIYCSGACACTEGTFMWEIIGCCEDGSGRVLKDRYKCIGGEWEYQYTSCGLPATCPRFP
ncbi:MAG TPA: hypothetical protein VF017_18595 [Thermoanaerobaculia bacterium]|nr:hypothetical protein [Thermoanaerobaculia bacterium]